jgi:hypothetical protein
VEIEDEEQKSTGVDAPKPPAHPPSRPASKAVSRAAEHDNPVLEEAMSLEEAEERAGGILPESIMSGVSATAWKEKQEAIKELKTWIEENPEQINAITEPIIRVLKHRMKDWKENNFNVIRESFEVITILAAGSSSISRRCAALVLNAQAVDKISDMKLNEAYLVCLS